MDKMEEEMMRETGERRRVGVQQLHQLLHLLLQLQQQQQVTL